VICKGLHSEEINHPPPLVENGVLVLIQALAIALNSLPPKLVPKEERFIGGCSLEVLLVLPTRISIDGRNGSHDWEELRSGSRLSRCRCIFRHRVVSRLLDCAALPSSEVPCIEPNVLAYLGVGDYTGEIISSVMKGVGARRLKRLFSGGVYLVLVDTREELLYGIPGISRVIDNEIQGGKLVVEEAAVIIHSGLLLICKSAVRHPHNVLADPLREALVYLSGPLRTSAKSEGKHGGGNLGHAFEVEYPFMPAGLHSWPSKELIISPV